MRQPSAIGPASFGAFICFDSILDMTDQGQEYYRLTLFLAVT
jgi:hypothetical protein